MNSEFDTVDWVRYLIPIMILGIIGLIKWGSFSEMERLAFFALILFLVSRRHANLDFRDLSAQLKHVEEQLERLKEVAKEFEKDQKAVNSNSEGKSKVRF
jgi:hypothetical protein